MRKRKVLSVIVLALGPFAFANGGGGGCEDVFKAQVSPPVQVADGGCTDPRQKTN